jgi:PAS domain S-box-containing protein
MSDHRAFARAARRLLPSPQGVVAWEWNLASNEALYSAGAAHLLGVTPDRLESDPAFWHGNVLADDRPRVMATVQAGIDQCQPWTVRYRLRRASGASVDVLERAFVVGDDGWRTRRVLGFVERDDDASVAQSVELPLITSLQQTALELRSLADFMPPLAWCAQPNGWLDYFNQRWYDYTGTTPQEMEGWGWMRVHDADDLSRVLGTWREALASGQEWEEEFRLRRGSDGMLRWHLSRARPMRDDEGRIIRWFGTCTDIHDQKLAAEERSRLLMREQQARKEAEAANQAKDEFLAVVSHELRTPLNAVLGWSQMLASGKLGEDKQRIAIEKIESNAKIQAKLIEDLLDVSRIITGKFAIERRVLSVGSLLRAAVDAAGPGAATKGVTLELCEEAEGARVRGDPGRLQQVVGNLLHNALKFTPAGRKVTVRCARVEEGTVTIEVHDEGAGISEEFLPRLFERFSQASGGTTRSHGGMGLGLAISRQIVELHGGEVAASSGGLGRGATFTIRLPELDVEEKHSAPYQPVSTRDAAPAVPLTGIKVLAVDDEQSSREVIAEVLLGCGAKVTVASGVHEALCAFEADRPDAIVSDIGMPEFDGYALVARVRAMPDPRASRTPMIALTAYASLQDRERALLHGFDRYLTKPLEPGPLSRMIAELVRSRRISR